MGRMTPEQTRENETRQQYERALEQERIKNQGMLEMMQQIMVAKIEAARLESALNVYQEAEKKRQEAETKRDQRISNIIESLRSLAPVLMAFWKEKEQHEKQASYTSYELEEKYDMMKDVPDARISFFRLSGPTYKGYCGCERLDVFKEACDIEERIFTKLGWGVYDVKFSVPDGKGSFNYKCTAKVDIADPNAARDDKPEMFVKHLDPILSDLSSADIDDLIIKLKQRWSQLHEEAHPNPEPMV
jgi:hypothetical protein